MDFVNMAEYIVKLFSPAGSTKILVFSVNIREGGMHPHYLPHFALAGKLMKLSAD